MTGHNPIRSQSAHARAYLMEVAESALAPGMDKSGNVLYSSVETLKPGPLYLFGLNSGRRSLREPGNLATESSAMRAAQMRTIRTDPLRGEHACPIVPGQ